jgi:hypothetical protein
VNASIRLSVVVALLSLAAQACAPAAQTTAARDPTWTPRAAREERVPVERPPLPSTEVASAQPAPRAGQEKTTAVLAWWPRERRDERAPIAHPALRQSRR